MQLLNGARRGDYELPPQVPPHLTDRVWRFLCDCGYTWHARTSAVVQQGKIDAPRQACTSCHRWISGRLHQ